MREGETLTQIAEEHGSTVKTLAETNRLSDPDLLHVGQVLKVPRQTAESANSWTEPLEQVPDDDTVGYWSLPQSKAFRDGAGIHGETGPRGLVKAIQTEDGSRGGFFLVKEGLQHAGPEPRFGHPHGSEVQVHGLLVTGPDGGRLPDGASQGNVLLKAQLIPRDDPSGQNDNPDSWFAKALGGYRVAPDGQLDGWHVRFDVGHADESVHADRPHDRGRTPTTLVVGQDHGEGDAIIGGGIRPPGGPLRSQVGGMARASTSGDGGLDLNGAGLFLEGGPSRRQAVVDLRIQDGGDVSAGITGGNGYHLGAVGFSADTGGQRAVWNAPSNLLASTGVRVDDPHPEGLDVAGFGGAKGRSAGGSLQALRFDNLQVHVVGDSAQAEVLGRDLHRKLESGEATWRDLPAGTAISHVQGDRSGVGAAGFYGLYSASAGMGRGRSEVVEVARPDASTWIVGRSEGTSLDGGASVGVVGVGPGVFGEREQSRGDRFRVDGPLHADTEVALQTYLDTGLLPGAESVDPGLASTLQSQRQALESARRLGGHHGHNVRGRHRDEIQGTIDAMNDRFRQRYEPGDRIDGLEGLTWLAARDGGGGATRVSALLQVHSKSRKLAREDHGSGLGSDGIQRSEQGMFRAAVDTQVQATATDQGLLFELQTRSTDAFTDPSVVSGLPNDVPPRLLAWANDGDRVPMGGRIRFALSDAQVRRLTPHADAAMDWERTGAHVQALLDGTVPARGRSESEAARRAEETAQRWAAEAGLGRDALERIGQVRGPEAFEALEDGDKAFYVRLQSLTPDAAGPLEARLLATAGRIESPPVVREAFAHAFSRVDAEAQYGQTSPVDEARAGQGDMTTRLVRFVQTQVSDPALESELLSQARFEWSTPSLDRLQMATDAQISAQLDASYAHRLAGKGPDHRRLHVDAEAFAEALLVRARRSPSAEAASELVWDEVQARDVDVPTLLRHFDRNAAGEVQRQMLAGLLLPAAEHRADGAALQALHRAWASARDEFSPRAFGISRSGPGSDR